MALRGNGRRQTCGYRYIERESHLRKQTHRKKHLHLYRQSESFGIFESFFQTGLNS